MAEHPNAVLMRKPYDAFAKGDMATLTQMFAEDVVWHLPGNNQLAGEHRGRDAVFAVFAKADQLTGGTFRIDLHDVLANDEHVVAMQSVSGSRGQQRLDARNVEIYHVRDGRVTEWWSFTNNPAGEDRFWS